MGTILSPTRFSVKEYCFNEKYHLVSRTWYVRYLHKSYTSVFTIPTHQMSKILIAGINTSKVTSFVNLIFSQPTHTPIRCRKSVSAAIIIYNVVTSNVSENLNRSFIITGCCPEVVIHLVCTSVYFDTQYFSIPKVTKHTLFRVMDNLDFLACRIFRNFLYWAR